MPLPSRLLSVGRYPALALLLLVTLVLAVPAARVEVERSNESMNATSDARVGAYGEFRRLFGNDEDVLIAIVAPGRLDGATLETVELVSSFVAGLAGVRSVMSVTRARRIVTGRLGAELQPLVRAPFGEPRAAREVHAALDADAETAALLVSDDRRTTLVVAELEDRPDDDEFRGRVVEAVRALRRDPRLAGWGLHVTGIAVQKYDVARLVARDQRVLVPLAVIVLALVLALCLRRAAAVVLPLAVTASSLVWTLGVYSLAGLPLNTITSLLAPVVMVLSVATSVHLYHGWLEACARRGPTAEEDDRFTLVATAVAALWTPCAFTALTTAFGLLSLALSDTPAVRQFGTFAAFGVLCSFVIALLLVPAGLTFLVPEAGRERRGQGRLIAGVSQASAAVATARPGTVLLSATALTLVSLAALPRLAIDTDLIRFLKPGAELRTDTELIDREVGGVASLELAVSRRDGRPLTARNDVGRVARFASWADGRPGVSGVLSVVPLVERLAAAEFGGELRVPEDQADLDYVFDLLAEGRDAFVRRLVVTDFTRARISVRVRLMGSRRAAALVAELEDGARESFTDDYEVITTGSFYHVALDSNRIVRNQIAMFAVAFSLIVCAIGVVFRSWRVTVLAIAPNVLPLLWTGALMSLVGIELSTGTTMIASVVIGLAVDDTIHYLARFGREYDGEVARTVVRTSSGVGRALVVTSLVLVLGFWVGAAGSFLPTVYFSLLSGVTMISALVCDLLVLPAALVIGDRSGLLRW